MEHRIIVDSCCDMTPALKEELGLLSVPLTLHLGQDAYTDDEGLDLPHFMQEMKACTAHVGSAAPSPYLYQQAIMEAESSFIITLSSRLSASYANALTGKSLAEQEGKADTYIFDSKSASAGEALIAIKLWETIRTGASKWEVIEKIERFIRGMKTYFALENYDNLLKNGRLSRLTERLIKVLNIRLVMGSDGDGNIAQYARTRGTKQMIAKMVSFIGQSGRPIEGESLVISHCNNPETAQALQEAVAEQYSFKRIYVIPTGGLSSLYADDKGIIMAF